MISCGLTGGIGSGKSTVCRIFQVLGIPVFNADDEAKKCYAWPDVIAEVRSAFGDEVLKEGEVDFASLAKIVFTEASSLRKINQIIHPRVMENYGKWRRQYPEAPYSMLESAIIFEAGLQMHFDRVMVVYAPENLCMRRVMKRDGITQIQAEARFRAQMDPEQKRKQADVLIMNDDLQPLIPQVIQIHHDLVKTTEM